jgi:hypothetical protein
MAYVRWDGPFNSQWSIHRGDETLTILHREDPHGGQTTFTYDEVVAMLAADDFQAIRRAQPEDHLLFRTMMREFVRDVARERGEQGV